MKADITYAMRRMGNLQHSGEDWYLVRVITPEIGTPVIQPVAVFNTDRESLEFQGYVAKGGTVSVDPEAVEKALQLSHAL